MYFRRHTYIYIEKVWLEQLQLSEEFNFAKVFAYVASLLRKMIMADEFKCPWLKYCVGRNAFNKMNINLFQF